MQETCEPFSPTLGYIILFPFSSFSITTSFLPPQPPLSFLSDSLFPLPSAPSFHFLISPFSGNTNISPPTPRALLCKMSFVSLGSVVAVFCCSLNVNYNSSKNT